MQCHLLTGVPGALSPPGACVPPFSLFLPSHLQSRDGEGWSKYTSSHGFLNLHVHARSLEMEEGTITASLLSFPAPSG